MTLQEFYDLLDQHDWYYQYSDDRSVYNRGKEQQAKIEAQASGRREFKLLLEAFRSYIRGSGPKPERPQ
jgi:hypothetical protein